MGVTHCQQIVRFSVNSVDYTDYLRIVYERPKGSLLPVSRTYRFPRIQKSVQAGDGKGGNEVVMQSDPALREALEELRDLVEVKAKQQDISAETLAELEWLEEELCMYKEHLRALIDKVRAG